MDEIAGKVMRLIAHRSGFTNDEITPDSALLHDLGVEGEDAADLIQAFADTFSVDMSAFQFNDYFGGEPSIADPLWFLPGRMAHRKGILHPVIVKTLIAAAEEHRWPTTPR